MKASTRDGVEWAAHRLDAAQASVTAIKADDRWPDLTLAEAYAVQLDVIGRRLARGERLVGLKLGFTSEAKMRQMGVDELIVGHLTDKMLVDKASSIDLATLIHPRVEPEIAFLIGADVDLRDPRANLTSVVSGVCAAIEVIDSRYQGFRFDLPRVVADNTSAAGFALGPWTDPQSLDLKDLEVSLAVNGETYQLGSTAAILGHPLRALERLTRLARQWDLELPAGSVVLAGAATEAIPLSAGLITVNVASVGEVAMSVKGRSR